MTDVSSKPDPTDPIPLASLVAWLDDALVDAGIHALDKWPLVLGASARTIDAWRRGEQFPSAEALRGLVLTLARYPAAGSVVARWHELSRQPLREVWTGKTNIDAPTLAHYVLLPLWDDLRLAVESFLPDVQDEVLGAFVGVVHRRMLDGREAAHASAAGLAQLAQARLEEATAPGAPFAGWRGFSHAGSVFLEPPEGVVGESDLASARGFGHGALAVFRATPNPGVYLTFGVAVP